MESEKLKKLGFKKNRPDKVDKNYFFFRKDIKHPFLKGLHVIVSEEYISVYCRDQADLSGRNMGEAVIYQCVGSESNLHAVLKWLSEKSK